MQRKEKKESQALMRITTFVSVHLTFGLAYFWKRMWAGKERHFRQVNSTRFSLRMQITMNDFTAGHKKYKAYHA